MKSLLPCILLLFFATSLTAEHYPLTDQSLDVVIPCAEKDAFLLDRTIKAIRENGVRVGRVIVVSNKRYTNQAEWFDEKYFPFTKRMIKKEIFHGKKRPAKNARIGWIYQQLLKLYTPLTIPGISDNVLILDADTVFIKPTTFLNEQGGGLFNVRKKLYASYFSHARRLLPGFKRVTEHSGVTHHMVFQRPIIEDLFALIEDYHGLDPWKAFCRTIDKKRKKLTRTASEYEIYFNFALSRTDQVEIRPLKWKEITNVPPEGAEEEISAARKDGCSYISLHQRH